MSPFPIYHMPTVLKSTITTFIAVSLCQFAGCKQRPSHAAPAARLRHVIGATSVPPQQALGTCLPPSAHLDAANYFGKIARHLMTENDRTFQGVYDPELFCIRARQIPDFNASSSAKTRSLAVDTGLLHMTDDQVDADIAMVIAHELAHITLQHGARDPKPSELPDDVDRDELDRRLRLKAVFLDKKESLRKSIAINGHTDDIYDDYIWLIGDLSSIIAALKPTLSTRDDAAIARATTLANALKKSFASLFLEKEDGKHDSILESNLMIQSRELIRTMTEDIPGIATAIKAAGTCTTPRNITYCLGQLANYQKLRVQPIATQIITTSMPIDDNPETYPPYAQWMETQADEVGYEFYLRAGFKPERFATFFKAGLKKKAPTKVEACLAAINQIAPTAPSRLDEAEDSKHPGSCFRLYDINITETLKHHSIYSDLAAKATLTDLPNTTGELLELRKNYPAE